MADDPLAAAAEIARRLKLDLVRRARNDKEADLVTTVLFVRGERVVGQILAGDGANAARLAAYAAASMFRPDAILVVSDSYMRTVTVEEADTVVQGSMQEAWEAGRREGISEAIAVMKIPREGDPTGENWPYARDGRTLTWSPVNGGESLRQVGGAIVDFARDGYADGASGWAKVIAVMGAVEGDPEAELHADRAAARLASERLPGAVVALYEDGIQRRYRAGHLVQEVSSN